MASSRRVTTDALLAPVTTIRRKRRRYEVTSFNGACGAVRPARGIGVGAVAGHEGDGAAVRPVREAERHGATDVRVADARRDHTQGDPKPAKLFAMRFDPDGVVQKTATHPAPPEERAAGSRADQEKKVAEFKEWAGDLVDLCKAISSRHPRCSRRFREGAHRTARRLRSALRRRGDFPGQAGKSMRSIPRRRPSTACCSTPRSTATRLTAPSSSRMPGGGPVTRRATTVPHRKKLTAKIENFSYVRQ